MGLKFGQKYQISVFFGFCSVSGRDKGFLSRQSFLVATLVVDVATYCCLSRHRSQHTAACRDIGRNILLLVATSVATYCLSRHTSNVATYFPDSSQFFSPTCRSHNFFVLTRIWACEYSLERYLNVECSHEGI